jgi:hypothetical protein
VAATAVLSGSEAVSKVVMEALQNSVRDWAHTQGHTQNKEASCLKTGPSLYCNFLFCGITNILLQGREAVDILISIAEETNRLEWTKQRVLIQHLLHYSLPVVNLLHGLLCSSDGKLDCID